MAKQAKRVTYRRIYDDPTPSDGTRVLVDRIWPRGLKKENAHYDEWLREVAPSTELRTWYGHDPKKFAEFRRRYLTELGDSEHAARLREIAERGNVTLLTASRDIEHSQAAVHAEWLSGSTD